MTGGRHLSHQVFVSCFHVKAQTQLLRKTENFISAVLSDSTAVSTDSLSVEERYRHEAERAKSMELQLQEMSPHYYAGRDGNASTIPEAYRSND